MLEISGVTKRFKKVVANDGVSLEVSRGQVVGLLGHNGAGKTTLVNQVVGIAKPDAGTITIDGIDAVASPSRARKLSAIQAQSEVPISGLTPALAAELVGRIRGLGRREVRERAAKMFDRLDLTDWAHRPTEKLSGGAKRLVSFVIAAVAPVPLLVLDEPTNDVDPVRRRLLWEEIRRQAHDGAAVLLVTHNVNEAERAVDHLVVLDEGRAIAAGTPSQLTAPLRDRMRLELRFAPDEAAPEPRRLRATERRPGVLIGTIDAGDATDVIAWSRDRQKQGDIETFALQPASLEDAYIALTGKSAAADNPGVKTVGERDRANGAAEVAA